MPRKTRRIAASARSIGMRFNEAAARCRGKLLDLAQAVEVVRASMRPRPDAAENRLAAPQCGGEDLASMRPRPDAAENWRVVYGRCVTAVLQ